MRIRCERCKAEYEVDENQMRGGRLEVQCSVCTHVFTVSKHGSDSPAPVSEESPWVVQTAQGSTQSYDTLAALQESILEGKLTAQDKVTHDRRTWQTLGNVPELAATFGSVPAGSFEEQPGSEPQESAMSNVTTRFVLEPKSHGLLKMSVGLAVAVGVAFAGIRWQQDRRLSFQSPRPLAAMPMPSRPAPSSSPDIAPADQAGSVAENAAGATGRPVVEALPSAPPPAAKKEPQAAAPLPHGAEHYDKLVAEADRALENGGNSRARDLYQRALNLRPGGFKAIAGLGFVALDRGQLPTAYEYFKRALTAKTSYPPALFGIAEVHRARGEKSLALHSYQRYLDMSPNGADAPAARRHVQNLQGGR